MLSTSSITVKEGFRGLLFQDGALARVLEPGRHKLPTIGLIEWLLGGRRPELDVQMIDTRDRDITIKGQEILTADKVAIRVSIVVQFQVTDPAAAVQKVADFADRLYSDVQLAARRSLAGMTLEEILTERNRLSEDILREVKDPAARYGVQIGRADVKDLVFPGNLQEIMNRVLAAERQAQAQLIEARTKTDIAKLEAVARAENERIAAEKAAEARQAAARADAEVQRIKTEVELDSLRRRAEAATAYAEHPALLRLAELETLRDLSRTANARLYIDFGPDGVRSGAAAAKTLRGEP